MLAVLGSWGACAENRGGESGGNPDGGAISAAALECLAAAEALNLTGEDFINFMYECLSQSGVIDP
jgi:hypothetical protein